MCLTGLPQCDQMMKEIGETLTEFNFDKNEIQVFFALIALVSSNFFNFLKNFILKTF